MVIGGFQKFSLIDYPGKTCAIIFCRGCNFRCGYCHNPELVIPERFSPAIPLSSIVDFLHTRIGKLDAVTITGGEPTLQADLIDMIKMVKGMGFLVKLDSNGSKPEFLKAIIDLGLVDYLAMDVKAALEDYEEIAGRQVPAGLIRQSIDLIMKSKTEYEFRTTVVKPKISQDDLRKIVMMIQGAEKYFLQRFIPSTLVNDGLKDGSTYSDQELVELAQEFEQYVGYCGVR